MNKIYTPVMFVIFNRLDVTKQVFEEIRKAKPEKLYIVSDCWRDTKPYEKQKVLEVRNYVESNIDWDCIIKKDYAEVNYGCRKRVSSGVSWVLSQEESVIVLEDDILPSQTFFEYCQNLLELYKNDEKVMMISGNNNIKDVIEKEYTFSCFSGVWGWATWKRAWKYYDDNMSDWPTNRKKGTLKYVMPGPSYLTLRSYFDYVYRRTLDSWAYVWLYCMCKNNGLGIVPRENLIKNIGFESEDATHTSGKSKYSFKIGNYDFPLKKISVVKRNQLYDKTYIKKVYPPCEALISYIVKCCLYIPRKIKKLGLK